MSEVIYAVIEVRRSEERVAKYLIENERDAYDVCEMLNMRTKRNSRTISHYEIEVQFVMEYPA